MWISICSCFIRTTNVYREKTGIGNSCNNKWSPLGSFYFLPLFQFLIDIYEWRGALLITGAFVLHGCAFGLMLVPAKNLNPNKSYPDVQKQNMGSIMIYSLEKINHSQIISADIKIHETMRTKLKTIFDPSVLKSLSIVFLHWMLFCLGYLVVYTFLPAVSSVYGIKDNVVSSMLSIFGVSDFIGRLSFGVMANTKKIKSVYLVCIVGSSSGAAYLCLTWIRPIPAMFVCLVVLGICAGQLNNRINRPL